MKATYLGKVNDDGTEYRIINKKVFNDHIFSLRGKEIEITLDRKKKRRSNKQNNYWAVIVKCVRLGLWDMGYSNFRTDESVREFLRFKFLLVDEVNEDTGEVLQRMKSTAELSTSEMNDLWAEVQQWAAEFLNIIIPDPDENWRLNL